MTRWLTLLFLTLLLGACQTTAPTASPTAPPALPSAVAAASEPTSTSLAPAATSVPSGTPSLTIEPPTETSTTTSTPTATATRSRPVSTRTPRPTATFTPIPYKYPPPELIEPYAGQSFQAGKDDLQFRWKPVADLGPNECYQVTVLFRNPNDPSGQWYGQSYLAQDSCGSSIHAGRLLFILYVKKHGQPDYEGWLATLSVNQPTNEWGVRWHVAVVESDDAGSQGEETTPLSPDSKSFEFRLLSP